MATKARKLKISDVTFTVSCEPEDEQIEGNASAIDPISDKETEERIRSELSAGNDWAWCSVWVRAHLGDLNGAAHLGCCSYKSEADFRDESNGDGYYSDMKDEALEDLQRQINKLAPLVCEEV